MPLDQLMAKYGYTANIDVTNPSHAPVSHSANAHASPSPDPMDTDPSLPSPSPPEGSAKPRPSKGKSKAAVPANVKSDDHSAAVPAVVGSVTAEAQQPAATKGKAVEAAETQQQAEQATAAGMDAFEHSQALAERRASGSQAGPSSASAPPPGRPPDITLPDIGRHCQMTAWCLYRQRQRLLLLWHSWRQALGCY